MHLASIVTLYLYSISIAAIVDDNEGPKVNMLTYKTPTIGGLPPVLVPGNEYTISGTVWTLECCSTREFVYFAMEEEIFIFLSFSEFWKSNELLLTGF